MKQLTRNEAAAVVVDGLKMVPLPFPYKGGWGQVLEDLVCISKKSLANMAADGRKTVGERR